MRVENRSQENGARTKPVTSVWNRLRGIASEEGSIEPALVMIPLLILILSTLQMASGVLYRTTVAFRSQAALYSEALFSNEGDSSTPISSGGGIGSNGASSDNPSGAESSGMNNSLGGLETGNSSGSSIFFSSTDLPGGGAILLGKEKFSVPSFTPLLPEGDAFTVRSFTLKEGS